MNWKEEGYGIGGRLFITGCWLLFRFWFEVLNCLGGDRGKEITKLETLREINQKKNKNAKTKEKRERMGDNPRYQERLSSFFVLTLF